MKTESFKKSRGAKNAPNLFSGSVVGASLIGAGIGFSTTLILTVIFSAVCLFSPDPDKLSAPLSLAVNILSFFVTGFAGAKMKSAAIPVGVISGGILTSVLWLISLILKHSMTTITSTIVFPLSLLIRLSFVIASVIGALLATNVRKKRKR